MDKYDQMIDAVSAQGRDKYDDLIDSVASQSEPGTVKNSGGILNAATTVDLDRASAFDPLAQGARLGQFANKGNQDLASIIAEKSGALAEMAGPYGPAVKGTGIAVAGALGTASEALLPQNRLGVASLAAGPLAKAYRYISPATRAAKPGLVAQMGQARTKVPAGDIQQAIDDPSVFTSPSVEAANAGYGKAVGPLQGATKSLGQKLDKTILGETDYTEAINRAGRVLRGSEMIPDAAGGQVPATMDPQTALEGVQSINRYLKNKAFTSKLDPTQISEIYQLKSELIGWMESNGTPDIRAAATILRKAHVKENLSKLLPQNKFGGNDALRTMFSTGQLAGAAGLALSGHPLAAAPIALEAISASPAVWGAGIRNYQAITNPETINMAGRGAVAGSNLYEEYRRTAR